MHNHSNNWSIRTFSKTNISQSALLFYNQFLGFLRPVLLFYASNLYRFIF
jgi:hypothetical protein